MHCKECGGTTPDGSLFCPQCGARLEAESDEMEPAEHDAPGGPQQAFQSGRSRATPPAEEELWSGSYSAKAMVGSFIVAGGLTLLAAVLASLGGPAALAAFGIGAILVWGALGLLYLYRRLTVRYRLSTYRFFHETGLLTRTGNRVEVIDIDDVTVQQGPIERMFGVGTIRIESSDKTHPELLLPGIDEARRVADLIDGTRRAERNRRGLHIESI